MGTITLQNFRTTADVTMNTRLKDGGVYIDWAGLTNIKAWLYSDAQKAMAGRCDVSINQADSTKLVCEYSANKPQYLGVQRLIIQAKYMGRTKTYDKPVFNFVPRTADQEGEEIVISDPDIDVEIDVEDVTSSILQNILAACIKATEEAKEVVDVHRGPAGVGFESLEQTEESDESGGTNIWTARLTDGTTHEFQVKNGQAGSGLDSVEQTTTSHEDEGVNVITFTMKDGTEQTVEIRNGSKGSKGDQGGKGDKGDQGNTGSSVDYPYELVNNRTTDDATKGLSAAEGKRMGDDISQLEQKADVAVQGSSVQSPNLFDKTAATTGNAIRKDSGDFYSSADWVASDYLDVSGLTTGDVVKIKKTASFSGVIGWAFYNSSKTFTHGGNSLSPAWETGDAYFRCSIPASEVDVDMLSINTIPSEYVPYGTLSNYALKDGIVGTSNVIDSAITTGKIADGAVTVGKLASGVLSSIQSDISTLDGRSDAVDAFLDPEQVVKKSSNLLDMNACQHGYIDNRDGSFHSLSAEGTYGNVMATDYIQASENGLYCSCYGTYGTVGKGAVYDEDKHYLRALNSGVYEYVEGDAFVRWTIYNTYTYLQVNEGNELGPLEPYYDPIVRDYIGNGNFRLKSDQIQGTLPPARTGFSSFSDNGTIGVGERVTAPQTWITKGIFISAEILGTIESVEVGVGRLATYGRWIEITPTSLVVKYGTTPTTDATYAHGLTLGTRTRIYIERASKNTATVRLFNDAGETYSHTVTWLTNVGIAFVYNGNSSGTIDASVSVMPRDIDKKVWVFGDSYCNITDSSRWPYYVFDCGFGNWLMNSYPGVNAQESLPILKLILATGARPATIVWCLGMNGGTDSSGNVNADWKAVTDELLDICDGYGITPVFQTIPTVPNYAHNALNTWIRNSGYRYIDVAAAVEKEGTTTWLGWGTDDALLSSDQVHPTAKGAVVIASKFLADFPELAIE